MLKIKMLVNLAKKIERVLKKIRSLYLEMYCL